MNARCLLTTCLSACVGAALVAAPAGATTPTAVPTLVPASPATTAAAMTPLLAAPVVDGPTARDVFVNDPAGQIESIAAGGHLVAWSVRAPATPLTLTESGNYRVTIPTSSSVVVVDERGGAPLTLAFGAQLVTGLRMVNGPAGPTEPQLAVGHCSAFTKGGCRVDLFTLTPQDPVVVTRDQWGQLAGLALSGRIDSGRRIVAGKRKRRACTPPLSVRDVATGQHTLLPPLPSDDGYPKCDGLNGRSVAGHYAFATVRRESPSDDLEADIVYGIDWTAGPAARWEYMHAPYRYSGGSVGHAFGPAIADGIAYWQETDDSSDYDLERDPLPGVSFTNLYRSSSPPITADGTNGCDIAATTDALYELNNVRCAWDGWETDKGGSIHRLVHPTWGKSPVG